MMLRDFTLDMYKLLLSKLKQFGYVFYSFEKYLTASELPKKFIILRHDVDTKPENALRIASIESKFQIKASFYFRLSKVSYNKDIMKKICELGHEIGYHYEDLTLAEGNYEKAIHLFKKNLDKLKKCFHITTICMHGSPLSKWDNKKIWEKYDYKEFGIIGEPYFDIDFEEILYITDTGRQWNGSNISIRDKVKSKQTCNFRSTKNILKAYYNNQLPNRIMINAHPQRWTNNLFLWAKELIFQNLKNAIKILFN